MKTRNILGAVLALFSLLGIAQAAIVTNINQTFEGYPLGALSTGSGWGIAGGLTTTITNSPVYAGSKAMRIERTAIGANTYSTSGGSNIPLNLTAESEYQWSFAFRVDSASATGTSFVYLDSGSGAKGFAGLRLDYASSSWRVSYFSVLTNGNASGATNYTVFGNITADTWYVATFDIMTDASLKMSQSISITGGTNYSGNVSLQSIAADTNTARMVWSPAPNGAVQYYDNLYLATVPEPGTLVLTAFFGTVALIFARRHCQRGSK